MELEDAKAALEQGPWIVIEIGPLGFKQLSIRLETDRSLITTHYEGQVFAFGLQKYDMSQKFQEAWIDGKAVQALKEAIAVTQESERDRSSLVTLVRALERSWKTGDPTYANEARIGLTVGAETAVKAAEDEGWNGT